MDRGAHYYKSDFQVHTPRDPRWTGPRPVSPDERQLWAESFVAACRSRRLDAVAVTDHHDFTLVPYIRAAAAAETDQNGKPVETRRQLVVFPAMELTLSALCQALLVLDANFANDRLPTVLSVLSIEPVDEAEPHYGQTTPLALDDLVKLHQRLDENDWLRGRYAVLPNVGDGAHGGLLRKGWAKKYVDMPCVGGYVDGSTDQLGKGNRAILAGEVKEWGNKPVAVLATSDARSGAFDDLGAHVTWIKWAEPTAEALRQAFLAQESRLSVTSPELPAVSITALHVSNSHFMGQIDLDLNPQYNAFIGGRGTGKSTCLEYMRWALCDQPPSQGDESDYAERRRRLIANTLESVRGQVEVHFTLNGVAHVVRRYAETAEVLLKVGDAEFSKANPRTSARSCQSRHTGRSSSVA